MNPMTPPASLLVKLGSMIVHYEEMTAPDGHHFDRIALDQLAADPEVTAWFAAMRKMAMLPVKRTDPPMPTPKPRKAGPK